MASVPLPRGYLYGIIFLTLFLAPNLAFISPGLLGTYAAYLVLSLVSIASLGLTGHRGLGAIGVGGAASAALFLAGAVTSTGFLFGFLYRRASITSTLVDLGLLLASIVASEVARACAMGLVRGSALKLLVGSLSGLAFGITFLSAGYRISSIFSWSGASALNLYTYLPQIIYSILVSEIQLLGGVYPAIAFRLVMDGYWRLSPLVPNLSPLGVLYPVVLSSIYLAAMAFLPGYDRIRGSFAALARSPLRRFLSPALDAFVALLIALTAYSLYAGIVPLVVISGSMEPTLSIGDIALIARGKGSLDIGVGDVIAFWSENQIVIHRVVGVVEGGYVTKGDAMASPDPFIVDKDMVVGRLVGKIPKIGWITIAMRSRPEDLLDLISRSALNPAISVPLVSLASSIAIYKLVKRKR